MSIDFIEAQYVRPDIQAADFDNAGWAAAKSISITRYWSGDAAPPQRHARAWLLWSDQALHVRFQGPQHEPRIVNPNPQTQSKTLGLWDRDVCEIYLAPEAADPNRYFEFEAAPTGEWVDLALRHTQAGRETDFEFRSGMSAAARIDDEQIMIGICIPWSEHLPRPQAGDCWRVNLFRCVGKDPNRGYLAWRPTYTSEPNFHSPAAFGELRFKK
jgi:alpha-galactosidase